MSYICFSKICIVLSLVILSTWCSGELHLSHPVHLNYLIVYPMFPDSELPSIFSVIFNLLYDFVWLNRSLIRMLTSTELEATFWKRSSVPAYLQVYLSTCSFSIQCEYFWNEIYTIYITILSPLDFLSLKKSPEVVPFFSLSLWKLCHLNVYPCWPLNKKALIGLSLLALNIHWYFFFLLPLPAVHVDFLFLLLQYLHGYLKG